MGRGTVRLHAVTGGFSLGKGILAGIGLGIILAGCSTQYTVLPISDLEGKREKGPYYYLPKTVLTLSVPITQTVVDKPSEEEISKEKPEQKKKREKREDENAKNLAWLAEVRWTDPAVPLAYDLDLTQTAADDATPGYSLDGKSITLTPRPVPDPEQGFMIDIVAGFCVDKNQAAELGPDGRMQTSSSTTENRSGEYALAAVQSAASVAHILLAGTGPTSLLDSRNSIQTLRTPGLTALETPPKEAAQKKPGEINPWQALATRLEELYQAKQDLLSASYGITNPDVLKAQVAGLDALIDPIVKAFQKALKTGLKEKTWTAQVEIDLVHPTLTHRANDVPPYAWTPPMTPIDLDLLTIQRGGKAKPADGTALPTGNNGTTSPAVQVAHITLLKESDPGFSPDYDHTGTLKLRIDRPVFPPLDNVLQNKKGFRYRTPVLCRLTVLWNDKVVGQFSDVPIAQLGEVRTLPRSNGGDGDFNITLYDDTGALKKVVANSKSPDPETISKVAAAAESAADKEMTASGTKAQLQQQKDALQLQNDIADLKKQLQDKADAGN